MRRRFATLALLLTAVGTVVATAGAETVQSGNIRVSFDGKIVPTALPREHAAPITVEVGGEISTTDGTHPPPLQSLRVELASAGQIDTHGLPACRIPSLQSTSSETALARCGPARVGSGTFEAQVELGGRTIPVDGRALVFNGVVGGRVGMLIHIYVAQPVRISLVIPVKISRVGGRFGTVLRTRVPKLASGFGSITELRLRLGRRFSFEGERHSYLSASCAAPAGFPGASFTLARGIFSFTGGRDLHAILTRHCEVRNPGRAG